jgi:outer membrane protein assembly factor BamE (lipoprotein component of BamABCDE complex)
MDNQYRGSNTFTYHIGFGAKKALLTIMTKKLIHYKAIRLISALIATSFGLFVAGCQSNDPNSTGIFQAHRVDIPQGNYVTKEMLAQVTVGMSQQQVKFALGAPLLTPVFSSDRWDYVFRHQFANGSSDLKRVVIRFKDAKVAVIEADELPTQATPNRPTPPTSGKAGS